MPAPRTTRWRAVTQTAFTVTGIAVIAVASVDARASDASPADGPRPPAIGDAAPPIAVETLNGSVLPGPPSGKITVVDFFATWCGPCHRGLADLAQLRDALGPRFQIVLVDVAEEPAQVRRFLADSPPPSGAVVALDRTNAVARRWGQNRFPTTFLVDESGVIRHINRGWGPHYRERMGRWLRAMLAHGDGQPAPAAAP